MTFDPATAVPEKPFDPSTAVLDEPSLPSVMQTAVRVNPGDAIRASLLSKSRNLPLDVTLRNLREVELLDKADQIGAKLQDAPKVADMMRRRIDFAMQAQDETDKFAALESNWASLGAAALADAALNLTGQVLTGVPREMRRIANWSGGAVESPLMSGARTLLNVTGPAFKAAGERFKKASEVLRDRDLFGDAFADLDLLMQNAEKATSAAMRGNPEALGKVIADPRYWAAAIGQAAPSLALAMATGGSLKAIMVLEALEQTDNVAEFEKKTGVKVSKSEYLWAVGQTATINGLLERVGVKAVLGVKGGLAEVLKAAGKEMSTEALQQLNTNLAAKLAYNPDQSVSEGVLMSAMGGAGSGGGAASLQNVASRIEQRVSQKTQEAQQAQQIGDTLEKQMELARDVKLRTENPDEFRAAMQQIAPGDVSIDGGVLNQLAPDVLAILPEDVIAQIPEAAATGSAITMSLADALTIAPGTPLEQVLVENGRINDATLSRAEAADAERLRAEFQADQDRIVAEAAREEQSQADEAAIAAAVGAEIAATQRMSKGASNLVGDWFTKVLGTFGSELAEVGGTKWVMDRYRARGLKFVGEATKPGAVLSAQEAAEMRAWLSKSSVQQPLYHGTNADIVTFAHNPRDIGFHAGTKAAANEIFTSKSDGLKPKEAPIAGRNVMMLYMRITNPLRTQDLDSFNYATIGRELQRLGLIPDAKVWVEQARSEAREKLTAEFRKRVPQGFRTKGDLESAGISLSEQMDMQQNLENEVARQRLESMGYDGIVYENKFEGVGDTYIAFRPEQIKSVFNERPTNDPNILKQETIDNRKREAVLKKLLECVA